ncbi:MAG: ABC transporter permease [Verrucomicrobiota bacterium]
MPPNLRIALRFLTARKRSMLMSLAGIVFGVGFFIVTQAQTSGFEDFFIRTILGTNGALRVEYRIAAPMVAGAGVASSGPRISSDGDIQDPERVAAAVRQFENVTGVSAILQSGVNAVGGVTASPARVFGVNLDDHLAVTDLARQILRGDLDDYRRTPNGALLGNVLAGWLQLEAGDTFTIETRGQTRRYRVSAIYETGIRDIDKERIYLHLAEARSLLQRPGAASYLQVALHDPSRAREDAAQIQGVIQHTVSSWQQREKTWLEVFRALRFSSALTVSTIILVAGLGMFNTLAMLVLEKTKEIAILRSMGYTRRDIARIFLWQGALVFVGGATLGSLFGAAATWGVAHLPIHIRGVFSTDSFMVTWSPWHYAAAVGTSAVVVLVASYLPARRAARLEPGDIVRGTAQ